nr:MAG: protein of unknown function DUF3310 [Bacteriophage sp.]
MNGNVDHPIHYSSRDIGHECIEIVQYQTFLVGNVIKYLWRYKGKGHPVEDLEKALWYAHRASMMQERVDLDIGHCSRILLRLVETTCGYESAVWYGLLKNEWHIVLSALDAMIKEEQ